MKEKYTLFWQNRSPFSNWYPSKFIHRGVEFTRGEQWMMYAKARMFADHEIAAKIMATDNPKEQKELGRLVKNYIDSIWDAHRFQIMVDGLTSKFEQNEKCKSALIATGTTIIAEASPYDLVWGIGWAENQPEAYDESKWRGENLLGKVLMEIRGKMLWHQQN